MKKKTNSTILSVAAIAAFYAATSYIPAISSNTYDLIFDDDNQNLKDTMKGVTIHTFNEDGDPIDITTVSGDTVNVIPPSGQLDASGLELGLDEFTINGANAGGTDGKTSILGSGSSAGFSAGANKELTLRNLNISNYTTAVSAAADAIINIENVTFTSNTNDIVNAGNVNITGTVSSTGVITSSGTLTINGSSSLTSTGSITIDTTGSLVNNGTLTVNELTANGDVSSTGSITNNSSMTVNGKLTSSTGSITNKGSFESKGTGSTVGTYTQTTSGASTKVTGGDLTITGANVSAGTVSVGNTSGATASLTLSGNTNNSISTGVAINETGTLSIANGAQYELTSNDTWKGTAKVTGSGSKLTIGNVTQVDGAKLVAESGTLESNLDSLTIKTNSEIKGAATVSLKDSSTLNVEGGSVVLDNADTISKLTVNQTGGTLELGAVTTGETEKVKKITSSGEGTKLKLSGATLASGQDSIAKAVDLTINGLTIQNTTTDGVTLDSGDSWSGALSLTGGKLTLAGISQDAAATFAATGGTLDIGDADNAQTVNITGSGNSIESGVAVNLVNGTVNVTGGSLELTNANDTLTKGALNLSNTGSLTVTGINTNTDTKINATAGTLNLTTVELKNSLDTIADNVKATVSGLTINTGATTPIVLKGTGSYADTISGNVTLTSGALEIGGYAADSRSGAFITNGGSLIVSDTMVFDKSADSIGAGTALTINKNVSVANGSFAFGSGDTLNTAATVSVDGGLLDLSASTSSSTGSFVANSGTVNVTGDVELANGNDLIAKEAILNVQNNLTVSASGDGKGVTLSGNDKIKNGKTVTVSGTGSLTADGFATGTSTDDTNKGSINATGGTLNIASGGLTLNTSGDKIADGAKVNIAGNLTINNTSTDGVTLDMSSDKDTITSGTLSVTNGKLNLSNLATADGIIFQASQASDKTTDITLNGVTLKNASDSIASAVKTTIGSGGLTINLTNTGDSQNVALTMGTDVIGGNVTLTNGNLAISGADTTKTGAIIANGGKLTIAGATTLSGNDVVAKNAAVQVTDGDLTIASGQDNYLNSNDSIASGKKVEVITGGKLTTDGFATTTSGGSLQATAGTLVVEAGGLTLANSADTINANATVTVTGPLNINGGNGVTLNGGDTWSGKITQSAGTLNLAGGLTSNGLLDAEGGILNIGTATVQNIALGANSAIKTAATVSILNGSQITVNGGELQLTEADLANADTNGSISAASGTVSLTGSTNAFSTEKVSLNAGSATVTLTNVTLANANDTIAGGATVTANGLTINNTNATGVTLTGGNDTIGANGVTLTAGKLVASDYEADNAKGGKLAINGGTAELTNVVLNNDSDTIATGAAVTANGLTINNANATGVTLTGGSDTIGTNGVTLTKGTLNVGGYAAGATRGAIVASTSGSTASFNVIDDLTLDKAGDSVTLDNSGDSIASGKTLTVADGTLTLNGYSTAADGSKGKIDAESGNLNVTNNSTLANAGDTIKDAVKVTVDSGKQLEINITNADTFTGQNVELTSTDDIQGTVKLTKGNLSVAGVNGTVQIDGGKATVAGVGSTGAVKANAGDVVISADTTLSGNSVIKKEANVTVSGGNLTIASNQDNVLNSGDTIASGKKVEVVAGGKLTTEGFATSTTGGSLQATGGTLVENGLTMNNVNDTIAEAAATTIDGNLAINAGSVVLNGINTATGTDPDNHDTLTSGTITLNGGSLTVGGFDAGKLSTVTAQINEGTFTLESGHFKGNIQAAADVDLQSGSTFHSTGETTLDLGDTWNGDIVIESGHVIIKDGIAQGGKLSASGGTMEIGYGDSSQTVAIKAGQTVTEGTTVKLTNGTINVTGNATDKGTLYLNGEGSGADTLTKGTINVDGGKLIMSDLSTNNDATNNVKLTASSGDVSLSNVTLNNDSDAIAAAVNVTIGGTDGLTINNANTTGVILNDGDNWNGKVTLTNGVLTLEGVSEKDASKLTATGGILNIGSDDGNQNLTLNANKTIANAVDVNINAGSTVTIADNGTLTLDHSGTATGSGNFDTLAGNITSTGALTLNKIDNGGKLTSTKGSLTATDSNVTIGEGSSIGANSTVKITGANDNTKGGSLTIKVDTTAHTDGTGEVTLNSGDTVNTTINLGTTSTDGGTLTITGGATIKDGTTLVAKSGTLNIADTQELVIGKSTADATTSSIAKEVSLNIGDGTKLTVKDGGAVTLNDIALTYAASPDSDSWTGEVELAAGGDLTITDVTAKTGWLSATGGDLTIDGFATNNAKDSILEAVAVEVKGDFLIASGNVTLNGSNTATGSEPDNKDTFTSGTITVSQVSDTQKGTLTISDVTTSDSTVQLVADGGNLNLKNVNLNSSSDAIKSATKVVIEGDDGLTITNASADVVLNTDDTWTGSKISLDGGKLSLLGADQGTGTITTADGTTLNIGTGIIDGTSTKVDQTLNIGAGSSISDGTIVTLDGGTNGSTINVTGGSVTLSQGTGGDTLTKGTLNVDGGTLTLTNVATSDSVKLTSTTNGGTLNLDKVTLGGSSDTIKDEVKVVVTNGITIDNTATGGVTLVNTGTSTTSDDSISGGVKLTGGNLTIGGFDTSAIGAIQASGGSLTVDGAKLTLKDAADEIAGGATVVIKSDLDVLTANGTADKYTVTLDGSDSIAKTATVKVDGGSMKVDGFKTTAKADAAADKGGINVVSGKLDIGTNGLELNNADDRILTAADVTLDGNLTVKDGQVELNGTGTNPDTLNKGIIKLDGDNAKLTATGIATKTDNSVSLNAVKGELVANGLTLNSTNDTIAAAVATTVGADGLTINKTAAAGVTLNDGDTWTGKVTLADGNLTLLDVMQGTGEITATGGTLTLGNGTDKNATITVSAASGTNSIAEAVAVNLQKGSSLTAGDKGSIVMNGVGAAGTTDTWNGALNVTDGGELSLLGITQGANATLAATGGTLNVGRDAGSGVTAAAQTLKITGSGNSVSAGTNVNLAANSSITTESGGALEINTGDNWKGTLTNNAGGTLTLSGFGYGTVQDGGKLIVNNGNLNVAGASVVIGTGSIIKDAATVVIAANTTTPETSAGGSIKILKDGDTAGSVVLNDGDIWNGEILLGETGATGGDLTIGKATTGDGAVLKATSGNLTIDNAGGDPLKITGDSFIKYDVNTNLKANSSLQIDNGDVVLSDNSTWDSTALVTLNNGKLQYVGIKQNGVLKGNGGVLLIGADTSISPQPDPMNTVLTVKGDSLIKDEVEVTVNGVLNIEEGTINLDGAAGAGQDTLAGGKIVLNQTGANDANLTMSNLATTNTYLQALKGNLNLSDVILDNSDDFIDYAVSFSMNTNDLNIKKGTVKLDAEDPILATGTGDKTISLNQDDGAYAMLGVDGLKTGVDAATSKKLTINLNKGHLEIEGRGLELNNDTDTIKQDIVTLIKGDLTMNKGTVYLDGGDDTPGSEREADVWQSGNIALTSDAKLQFKDFEANSAGATKMTMTKTVDTDNPSVELIGSKVTVADASDIAGGTMILDANSVINLGAGSYQLDTMKSSGTVNTINGAYDNYNAGDMLVLNPAANTYASVMDGTNSVITDGNAKFAIDLYARQDYYNYNSDTFTGTNLTSDDPNSDAVITICDWTLNGRLTRTDAPIDRMFRFKNMFNYENIDDNIKFDATDKEQFTPIGYYRLFADDDKPGDFLLALTRYNKQVFRGQVVTQAQFRNQQAFDDMVTSNVLLHGSRKVADYGSNRFALASPNLGPYQYTAQEGGLWMKSYADIEKLHFNQDINANNVAYGVVVGADFPMIEMKKGWKFIPTPYIGYNGAHQAFNGVSTYQYGGQLGFMGTFMKGNFISSNTIYGGGYYNDMHVDGVTDSTTNWFWGTANKMAYNWTIKRHFTIQPTMFLGYTMYGPQNYHTEFGDMSMRSGMLNGINVAPGMNFIFAKRDWSVYAGWQYFYNINDQVSGHAGNVDLPSLRMKRGYIQYGLGATKNIKDELATYAQVMWRNGGRTGLAFQMGLQYYYDVREIGGKIHDSYTNFKETREQKAAQKREEKRAQIITTKGVKAVPVSNVEKPTFKTKVKNMFKRNK